MSAPATMPPAEDTPELERVSCGLLIDCIEVAALSIQAALDVDMEAADAEGR